MTSETKQCQNCKIDFKITNEDMGFYERIKVPPPTFCPECRFIRRLIWRNERSLYKNVCQLCNKKIISMYDKNITFSIYCPECWKSDNWNPEKYAQEYDFSKSFFEQWRELFYKVPRQSLWQLGNNINSKYANFIQDVKNVYLSYSTIWGSEDVYYSTNIDGSKEIIDSYNVLNSELIYENIGSANNYNSQYNYWSSNCIDCNFVLDCNNCQNCFNCFNLRSKNYCIWNKQYSKEEYFEKIKEFNTGSYKFIKENYNNFWNFSLKFPKKYTRIINSVDSTGDEIRDCKNSKFIFNTYDTENSKFIYRSAHTKDSMDSCYMDAELAYEHSVGGSDNSLNIKFIIGGAPALNEVEYCDLCQSSSNLFGCIGLKSKQYCILNKQYTKEEYEKMIPKIIKHMNDMPYIDKKGNIYKYGEFFPFEFSPFGYNETVINEIYPLSKEEIIKRGYSWKEEIKNKYTITKKAEELPDDIKNVDDSILKEVIECANTKKAFKITPFELQFYRRMNIPLPRLHQDERYKKRFALRNPLNLWHRKCQCDGIESDNKIYKNTVNHPLHNKEHCPNEFETSYSPNKPEIVYCESCYNKEVY